MEKIKKFLIVMPVYNKDFILEQCINSVLSQSYNNFNLVMVNDCSTDRSYEIMKKFQNDHRVVILNNEKNMGCYYTRNRAIDYFKKQDWDIFAIHDADDISEIDRLKSVADIFENRENMAYIPKIIKIPYFKLFKIMQGNVNNFNKDIFETLNNKYKKNIKSMISKEMSWIDPTNGVGQAFYSRGMFEKLGFFDQVKFSGDDEYLERAKKLCQLDSGYSIVYQNEEEYLRYISIIYENNLTKIYQLDARNDYLNSYRSRILGINNVESLYVDFNNVDDEV